VIRAIESIVISCQSLRQVQRLEMIWITWW